jgi:hypothetical protein
LTISRLKPEMEVGKVGFKAREGLEKGKKIKGKQYKVLKISTSRT